MAKIEFLVCDRCGLPIKRYLFSRLTGKINVHHVLGIGPYSYSDDSYDLCQKCSDELRDWLHPKEADHE